ncbi:MAG: hypothetical protein JWM19_2216 [Actinomycetia bacterium]|nr:hypothetical protein [Actinomycetes bacterium]
MAASRWRIPGTRESSQWRFVITPKWLGWHVFVILSVLGMLWLGNWQLHRAESGNSLSWAYTFEWPLFAIFAVVFWVKTIRDEVHPPAQAKPGDAFAFPGGIPAPPPGAPRAAGGGAEPAEDDEELAPYHAYLARLTKEVRGHGRWHGLR